MLVSEGVRNVREMERHIKIYVRKELFRDQQLPSSVNRRYHPTLQDIRNHMYKASVKLRFAKLDQSNLEAKLSIWKQQHPDDSFFFRGYGKVCHEEDNQLINNNCDKDNVEVSLVVPIKRTDVARW